MAINGSADLTHIIRSTKQWVDTFDKSEIIPSGVLCVEFTPEKSTLIKIGDGHHRYADLPYVTGTSIDLSDYYTKEEVDAKFPDNIVTIKGLTNNSSNIPETGENGDLWFVESTDKDGNKIYDHYIWYDGEWRYCKSTSGEIDIREYVEQIVNEFISALRKAGELHTHKNKEILDNTTASYTKEEKEKLKTLENYDDTELRDLIKNIVTHSHDNKEILDRITAAFTKEYEDKLNSLENYDDTAVLKAIGELQKLAHSHDNKDILDKTTAAFTEEYEYLMRWIRKYTGATMNDDGIMGLVPPAERGQEDYVLTGAGEWVPMEGGGGSGIGSVTAGPGIDITKETSTNTGSTSTIVKKQYTTLEYVQSDGTQKIVTDLFFNEENMDGHTYIIETNFYTMLYMDRDQVFIGMGPLNKTNSWMLLQRGQNSSVSPYSEGYSSWKYCLSDNYGDWTGSNSGSMPSMSLTGLQKTVVNVSKSSFGQSGWWSSYNGYGNLSTNPVKGPLTIFGAEDTDDANGICTIGYIKMSERDVAGNVSLLHHLVPAVDEDGTVGFIDKLTNKFYGPTSGSGLLSGPVTEEIIEIETEVEGEPTEEEVKSYKVSLKPSTVEEIGGVKPGTGLDVDFDGTLNVKYGDGLTLDEEGNLITEELEPATDEKLGGVKIGRGLEITDDGMLSVKNFSSNKYIEGDAVEFKEGSSSTSVLPEEYQQLEYIEGTGSQYLVIPYFVKMEDTIEMEVYMNQGTSKWEWAFGSIHKTDASINQCEWICRYNNTDGVIYYVRYDRIAHGESSLGSFPLFTKFKVTAYKENISLEFSPDDIRNYSSQYGMSGDAISHLMLFACNVSMDPEEDERFISDGIGLAHFRLYSFRILDSDKNVLYDMIPCKEKATGDIGIYNIIDDTFIKSKTSVNFIGGPTVGIDTSINVKYDPNTLAVNENNELTVIGGGGGESISYVAGDAIDIHSSEDFVKLTPNMTSFTTPEGEVIQRGQWENRYGWLAFDGIDNKYYTPNAWCGGDTYRLDGSPDTCYVGYLFEESVGISRFVISFYADYGYEGCIQVYTNKEWITVVEKIEITGNPRYREFTFDIPITECEGFRFSMLSGHNSYMGGATYGSNVCEFEAYGYRHIPSKDLIIDVKYGDGLTLDEEGKLKVDLPDPYELPAATETTLGGIIVGDNLTIEEDGKLSAVVPEIRSDFIFEEGPGIEISATGEAYEVLEYIKSTGDQVILIDQIVSGERTVNIKYFISRGTSSQYMFYEGIKAVSGTWGYADAKFTTGEFGFGIGIGNGDTNKFTISTTCPTEIVNDFIHISPEKASSTIIDEMDNLYGLSTTSISSIFGYKKSDGTYGGYATVTIWYIKEYSGDNIILDLVPVKRVSDGAVGFLNKLNNRFYGNSTSSSVPFIQGYPTGEIIRTGSTTSESQIIEIINTGVLDVKPSAEKNQIIVATKNGDKPINIDIESNQGVLDVKSSDKPNQIIITTADGDKEVDIDISATSMNDGYVEGEAIQFTDASTDSKIKKNPTMTSYTAPEGTVIYSGEYSGRPAYGPFDGIDSKYWDVHSWSDNVSVIDGTPDACYDGYMFDNEVSLSKFIISFTGTHAYTGIIQVHKEDGWETVVEEFSIPVNYNSFTFDIDPVTCDGFRCSIISSVDGNPYFSTTRYGSNICNFEAWGSNVAKGINVKYSDGLYLTKNNELAAKKYIAGTGITVEETELNTEITLDIWNDGDKWSNIAYESQTSNTIVNWAAELHSSVGTMDDIRRYPIISPTRRLKYIKYDIDGNPLSGHIDFHNSDGVKFTDIGWLDDNDEIHTIPENVEYISFALRKMDHKTGISSSEVGSVTIVWLDINDSDILVNKISLNPATIDTIGGVKPGKGLTIDEDGTLNADIAPIINGIPGEEYLIKSLVYTGTGGVNNIVFPEKPLGIISISGLGKDNNYLYSTPTSIDNEYMVGIWGGATGTGQMLSYMSFEESTNTLTLTGKSHGNDADNFNVPGLEYTVLYAVPIPVSEAYIFKTLTYTGNGEAVNNIVFPEKPEFVVSMYGYAVRNWITCESFEFTSNKLMYQYGGEGNSGVGACSLSFNEDTNTLSLSQGYDRGAIFNISGEKYVVRYAVKSSVYAVGRGNGSFEPYELPIATKTDLGGIKIGDGLEILEDGTVNVIGGSGGSGHGTINGSIIRSLKYTGNGSNDNYIQFPEKPDNILNIYGKGMNNNWVSSTNTPIDQQTIEIVYGGNTSGAIFCKMNYDDETNILHIYGGNSDVGGKFNVNGEEYIVSYTVPVRSNSDEILISKSFTYIGTGTKDHTIQFPEKPEFINTIVCNDGNKTITSMPFELDSESVMYQYGGGYGDGIRTISVSFDEDTNIMRLYNAPDNAGAFNETNVVYTIYYLTKHTINGGIIEGSGSSEYELLPATTETLGGVIVGDGLTINENGVISVIKTRDDIPTYDAGVGIEIKEATAGEYDVLEYATSNRAQYVVTDLIPGDNTEIYVKYQLTSVSGDSYLISSGYLFQDGCLMYGVLSAGSKVICSALGTGRSIYAYNSMASDLELHEDTYTVTPTTFGSTLTGSQSHSYTINKSEPIQLFAIPRSSTYYGSDVNLYAMKVTVDGELIADIIPVRNKKTSDVGLYNKLTGAVYYSNTGTSLVAGPETGESLSVPSNFINVKYDPNTLAVNENNELTVIGGGSSGVQTGIIGKTGIEATIVPQPEESDYYEISYIRNNADAYIVTDYIPRSNTRVVVEFSLNPNYYNADQAIFGSRNGSSSGSRQFVFWAKFTKASAPMTGGFVYGGNASGGTDYPSGGLNMDGYQAGERLVVDASVNGVYLNGEWLQRITNTGSPSPYPLCFFACGTNQTGSSTAYKAGSYTLYSAKIYEDDELVCDFVPAVNKAKIAGLYDKISKTFYPPKNDYAFAYDASFINVDGINYDINLLPATNTEIGGVKPGAGLKVDENGVLSISERIVSGVDINFIADTGLKIYDTSDAGVVIPDGYSLISYVENKANTYTELDYYISDKNRVVIRASFKQGDLSSTAALFGSRPSNGTDEYILWVRWTTTDTFPVVSFANGSQNATHNTDEPVTMYDYKDYQIATFETRPNDGLYIDNVKVMSCTGGSITKSSKLFHIGHVNGGSSSYNAEKMRIHKVEIYEDDRQIFNLIPVINPDNRAGLFDTVRQKFFLSKSATSYTYDAESVDVIEVEKRISLLPATTTTIGGIKVGNGLTISEDGVLSVTGSVVPPSTDPTESYGVMDVSVTKDEVGKLDILKDGKVKTIDVLENLNEMTINCIGDN